MTLIIPQVPLADKNWFRTGGSAHFFAEPQTEKEFQEALIFAQQQSLPIFLLGSGANILIDDEGFKGLVIRPALKQMIRINENEVQAGSGTTINDLIVFCLDQGLVGLEDFSGIPGTVGGSIFINLHYFSSLLGNFLKEAQVIESATGNIHTVDKDWFNFGYNQSTLHTHSYYLLNATFTLTQANEYAIAYARGRRDEIIRHRIARYPNSKTCGSFFRNFTESEVTLTREGKKIIWIAYYLDKVGVKGQLQIGGALVSHQHANMIVTVDNATTNDIVQLARLMQEKVYTEFGIIPQPECQLIGFKSYPLYR